MDTASFKEKLRQHGTPPVEPPRSAEAEIFVTYPCLPDHGIPKYSRVHMRRLVSRGLFPAPVWLSPNRQAWKLSDLLQWKASRIPTTGAAA